MAATRSPSLDVGRGLLGAAFWACGMSAVTNVILYALVFSLWLATGLPADQFGPALRDVSEWIVPLSIVVFGTGAGAGWATHAPAGQHSFGRSMAVVYLFSVPLWYAVLSLELTPRRSTGITHPLIYPSEVAILLLPPLIVAAWLTIARVRAASAENPPPEN